MPCFYFALGLCVYAQYFYVHLLIICYSKEISYINPTLSCIGSLGEVKNIFSRSSFVVMGIRQQQRLMFTLCNFDSRDDVPGPVHAAAGSTGVQSYHVGVHLFSRTHRDHTRSPHERKVLLSTKCEYILACVTISTSICSDCVKVK